MLQPCLMDWKQEAYEHEHPLCLQATSHKNQPEQNIFCQEGQFFCWQPGDVAQQESHRGREPKDGCLQKIPSAEPPSCRVHPAPIIITQSFSGLPETFLLWKPKDEKSLSTVKRKLREMPPGCLHSSTLATFGCKLHVSFCHIFVLLIQPWISSTPECRNSLYHTL